ncbi:MAG TPA: long-chain fatty acid--CoA ligase [Syntrophales bacterium]|nr:long-chain fatty acid--CoA ligase [Syntrophales bacterium]HQB31008.1 long-chain fatty acid--CoA ligase [Syntrophales bacterium]HQN79330.1 long-chain fatty acid--CoA ligase [Syntrophales bacterium]HQQ28561.1 long-chain fatty acid--CoA ligase [Syntrophales bacterium]
MTETSVYEGKPWLKSYEKGVPEAIDYEEIPMPDILERTAKTYPDRDALLFQGYRVNYRQMKDMVDRFATCLADFGVRRGDAVAILLPNVIPCVIAYFAVLKLGAATVMNNPMYSDRELEHQFNDSGSKVLITLDLLGNRMTALRPKTKISQIVYTSIGDYLPFPKSLLFPLVAKKHKLAADVAPAPDLYRWKDCIAKYPPNPPKVKIDFGDVAMFQYTGGTTGVSKGVMLTHANLSCQVQQLRAWFPKFQGEYEIMLGALPYFHVFGMSVSMNFSVHMGWCQVLIPRPQPQPLLEAIRKFRPTFAPLVPTMYVGMLNHPDLKKTDLSCIKGAFSGSAPLPVEVIHEFERMTGAVIVEGFGMTETTPVTHVNPFAGGARKVGSVGLPISDTLCRIVDLEDGTKDMPPGQSGELIVKGPQVMKGYLNKEAETASTLRDGWCYTGDIAIMDDDGYFSIVDRKKDMIISGGFNIYPREIDEIFYEHPKVQEACSIGIPDPKRGENVKVFLVLKEGEEGTSDEFMAYAKSKLATYKLPVEFEFRSELPKSTVGKVLRKELKAEEMAKRKKA